jgi:hypothetical protein
MTEKRSVSSSYIFESMYLDVSDYITLYIGSVSRPTFLHKVSSIRKTKNVSKAITALKIWVNGQTERTYQYNVVCRHIYFLLERSEYILLTAKFYGLLLWPVHGPSLPKTVARWIFIKLLRRQYSWVGFYLILFEFWVLAAGIHVRNLCIFKSWNRGKDEIRKDYI